MAKAVLRLPALLRLGFCVGCLLLAGPARSATTPLESAWNTSTCASSGCHYSPISATNANQNQIFTHLGTRFTTTWCSGAGAGTTMCSTYGSYFTSSTDTALGDIYDFVLGAANTVVTSAAGNLPDGANLTAFAATALGSTAASQTITVTNYRNEALSFQPSVSPTSTATNAGDFGVVNSSCTLVSSNPLSLSVGAATGTNTTTPTSCSFTVQFHPTYNASAARAASLQMAYSGSAVSNPPTRTIGLSGTAQFPVYTPAAFAALTSPGFSAATNGSSTICRTITNSSATTASLSLAFAVVQASGASTDYSSYYQLDALTACPNASPPLCVAAGAAVTGSTALAGGASCTLALKFNPGQFGFAGLTGARPAQLNVTHNAPAGGPVASYTLTGTVTIGPEPQIGFATGTAPVDAGTGNVLPALFAQQVINTTSVAWTELQVSNTGTVDGLEITQVLNSDPSEFTMTQNCVAPPTLARQSNGGSSCTIGLSFRPTALGLRCTTITVRATVSTNVDPTLTVCGTGVPVPVAQLAASRTAIAFGQRSIGAVYPNETLTLTNAAGATADLLIGAIGLSSADFSFVPDASACQSKTLVPGASCTLQLQFTPSSTTAGLAYAATLTVASNDPTTPTLSVPLSATAVAYSVPALSWTTTSTSVSFPTAVAVGQAAATPIVLHLTNAAGPGAVDVAAVRLVGADAASFTVGTCPALLNQGDVCDLNIGFTPASGGAKTAQLQVLTTTGVAPPLITVQGQGVGSGAIGLVVSSSTLDFGGVRVGANSAPLEVRLTASGDGTLQVTGISVDGPFSVSMKTCPMPPFSLPSGSDCSVNVSFVPTGSSTVSGKLSITSGSGASTTVVALDGNGQDAANVSGGGCSIARGETWTDPTLIVLVLVAMGVLWKRRRARGEIARDESEERP